MMKPPHWIVTYGLIVLLSAGLAFASVFIVRPADCQKVCDEPEQAACPEGACRFGEQRAGFPLPVIIDSGGGSSPTSGWGKLGPEDLPNPITFLLDAAFYGTMLFFAWHGRRILGGKEQPAVLTGKLPLLVPAIAILLTGLLIYRPTPVKKPPASAPPELAILGNWRSTDTVSGEDFILRFYESGRLSIVFPDREQPEGAWGEYRWSRGDLQIVFQHSDGPGAPFCASLVTFLQEFFQTKLIDPVSYPSPVETPNPAYPAPTVGPVVFSRVDEVFRLMIAENILILTHPSGHAQTLYRVVGN